jgi:hypothetical protein
MHLSRLILTAALAALAVSAAGAAEPASAPASSAPPPAAPAPGAAGPAAAPAAAAPTSAQESLAGPTAAPTAESILLQLSDRLTDEAERQHQVNQRMDYVIDRFQAVIADLESNDLIRQAGGPAFERLVQVLKILSARHVPDAARYLEEARRQLAALKPNLIAADKEIEIIIRELEKILASAVGQGDDLLRELEVIIRDEKRANQDTRQWGALLLQTPEAAERPRKEIAAVQDRIARRTERFMERLAQARDAETDPGRHLKIEKAHGVLDQNKVPKILAGATRDIEDKKPVSATRQQAEAIKWLEEAARLLRPDDAASDIQALKEFRDRLEKILREETELREKTEKVPAEKFPEHKNDLQVEQRAIDKETRAAANEVPPPASPEVKTHIQTADSEMQKAENQIARTEQQPATQSQKEAEKALQEAIRTLDKDIAAAEQAWQQQNQPMQNLADLAQKAMELAEKQKELRQETGQTQPQNLPQLAKPEQGLQQQAQDLNQQLPMPQFQQAAHAMDQAAQDLNHTRQQPAMQEQQKAIDALMSAAQALQQAQAALDLAAQQMQLMQQTAQTPQGQLPQLAPPQQGLQHETQAAQFPEAAREMGEAAQNLEQGQGQEAQHDQQAAIDSLLGQAAHAMGMEPGQPHLPGTMPGMVMMPGLMPGRRAMPLVQTPVPREMGIRDFGRGGIGGPQTPRGDDHWQILGARQRDTLYQKYARQLPPEYRDILGDYFEALSKEPQGRMRRPAAPVPPGPPSAAPSSAAPSSTAPSSTAPSSTAPSSAAPAPAPTAPAAPPKTETRP